jgi:TatA/E family protein of Tat protein translocase
MGIENPVHLLFIALVALIVLGPKRLPALARALGQGLREFRGALDQAASQPAETAAPPSEATEPAASPQPQASQPGGEDHETAGPREPSPPAELSPQAEPPRTEPAT